MHGGVSPSKAVSSLAGGGVAVGANWAIVVVGWATILVLLAFRRFRRLFVFLGAFSVKASVGRDPLRGVYA